VIPIRRLTLTKFTLTGATRGARTGVITKAIKKSDPFALYAKSNAAKKTAKKAVRASLTDFDRFRVLILRKRVLLVIIIREVHSLVPNSRLSRRVTKESKLKVVNKRNNDHHKVYYSFIKVLTTS
jgi:uncharacterized protein YaeQ